MCYSFTILKAIAKSNGNLFALAFKNETTIATAIIWRAITIEREIKERNIEIIPKIKQKRLRAITLQGKI